MQPLALGCRTAPRKPALKRAERPCCGPSTGSTRRGHNRVSEHDLCRYTNAARPLFWGRSQLRAVPPTGSPRAGSGSPRAGSGRVALRAQDRRGRRTTARLPRGFGSSPIPHLQVAWGSDALDEPANKARLRDRALSLRGHERPPIRRWVARSLPEGSGWSACVGSMMPMRLFMEHFARGRVGLGSR